MNSKNRLKKLAAGLAAGASILTAVASSSLPNTSGISSPIPYDPRPAYCNEITQSNPNYNALWMTLKPTQTPGNVLAEEVVESLNPKITKRGDLTYFHTAIDSMSLNIPVPESNSYHVNELQSLPEMCSVEPGIYFSIDSGITRIDLTDIDASFAADITKEHLPWARKTLKDMLPNLGTKSGDEFEVKVPYGFTDQFLNAYRKNPSVNSIRRKE